MKFMRNFFGDPAKILRTTSDVEVKQDDFFFNNVILWQDYLEEEEGSVIGFIDNKNEELMRVYTKVAEELRDLGLYFGWFHIDWLMVEFDNKNSNTGLVTKPALRLNYSKFDGKIVFIRSRLLDSVYEDRVAIYEVWGTPRESWI